jgi:hypothetical protein
VKEIIVTLIIILSNPAAGAKNVNTQLLRNLLKRRGGSLSLRPTVGGVE